MFSCSFLSTTVDFFYPQNIHKHTHFKNAKKQKCTRKKNMGLKPLENDKKALPYPSYEAMCRTLPMQLECDYTPTTHTACSLAYDLGTGRVAVTPENYELLVDMGNRMANGTTCETLRCNLLVLKDHTPIAPDSRAFDIAWSVWKVHFPA